MNRIFINHPLFRICSGPLAGLMIYLLILLINNIVEDIDKIYNHSELYACIGLSYLSFESMRLVIRLLDRFSAEDNFQKKLITRAVATIGISLVLVAAAISAYFKWVEGFSIGSSELNLFLFLFGAAGILYNILYFSHLYLQRENKSIVDQENQLREKIEADFSTFRNDINPDLLYESLENLILTLHHDTDLAEEQIDSLAGIYRYSLINRQQELVTLEDEISAAGNLLYLLNFKYEDSIQFLSTVQDPDSIHLIPGSLMVTIDSIVRNTLISKKTPLIMRFYIDDDSDYLVLEHTINNRLVRHSASLNSFDQLQRSYLFFSENPFVQVKAGHENFIKFPLVRIQQIQEEIK